MEKCTSCQYDIPLAFNNENEIEIEIENVDDCHKIKKKKQPNYYFYGIIIFIILWLVFRPSSKTK
jgi:hypothetical protein